MRIIFTRVLLFVVIACMLLFLCSCCLTKSFKEFSISNITGRDEKDYLSSNDIDFARVNGVAIIPEIKEIRHGVYTVYVSAYSEMIPHNMAIKRIALIDNDYIILDNRNCEDLKFTLNHDNLYSGTISSKTFTDDGSIVDSNQINLIVEVAITVGEKKIAQEIFYEVNVKSYMTFVTVT